MSCFCDLSTHSLSSSFADFAFPTWNANKRSHNMLHSQSACTVVFFLCVCVCLRTRSDHNRKNIKVDSRWWGEYVHCVTARFKEGNNLQFIRGNKSTEVTKDLHDQKPRSCRQVCWGAGERGIYGQSATGPGAAHPADYTPLSTCRTQATREQEHPGHRWRAVTADTDTTGSIRTKPHLSWQQATFLS